MWERETSVDYPRLRGLLVTCVLSIDDANIYNKRWVNFDLSFY